MNNVEKNALRCCGLLVLLGSACVPLDESPGDPEDSTEGSQSIGPLACEYPQTFGNSAHTGIACPELTNMHVAQVITQDPDADAEAEFSGFMQIHASAPLTKGDWAVIPAKSGFVDGFDRSPERYHVEGWRQDQGVFVRGSRLTHEWSFRTDWQPINGVMASFGYVTNGYVQQFGPAIANGSVYVPGRRGRIYRVSLTTGALEAVINPLAGTPFDGDERAIVNSALSFNDRSLGAHRGTVYLTLVAWPLGTPNQALRGVQPRGSWLVAIRPDDTFSLVDFRQLALAAGAPVSCEYPFGTGGTPPATGPDSRAPIFNCGDFRPAINAPVAVDPRNDNLVMFAYANNAQGAAALITADATTFAPISFSDTRGHLMHGCGRRLSLDFVGGSRTSCSTITNGGVANIGFDPDFNGPVRFRGEDIMDSAPTVAPNGDACIGSYDGGFTFGGVGTYDARGAGVCFDGGGAFKAKNEDFFWEVTLSAWQHGTGFSYLTDENHWSDFEFALSQRSPDQELEAQHAIPLPDFDPDLPTIDWVDAHIVFGPTGDRYAVNSAGSIYKFRAGQKGPVEEVQLLREDGTVLSMSTLSNYSARDPAGRWLLSYAGKIWVIESSELSVSSGPALQPLSAEAIARLRLGRAMKAHALASTTMPEPPAPMSSVE
jgi:hypothetical protein